MPSTPPLDSITGVTDDLARTEGAFTQRYDKLIIAVGAYSQSKPYCSLPKSVLLILMIFFFFKPSTYLESKSMRIS